MKLEKNDLIYISVLLALTLFFFFFKLGNFSLFDVDEPRYAEAAREMLESGNWITPYFNYEVRFAKPILFYWMIAGSYLALGVNEFAARLPSAIMALLTVFAVFFFGKKHINSNFGFISALVTTTAIQFIALGRMSITDMTLSAFVAFMLLAGFTAAHSPEPAKKYYWYLFYICMGLGVITKGPVVGAFAVMVLGPYFVLTGKFKETLKSCYLLPGIVLFLLVTVPWYAMVIFENGQPYIDQFFLTDNFKRFTGTVSGHKGPIYFFFIVVLVGFIPWSAFLPYALYKYLKPLVLAVKNQSSNCHLEPDSLSESQEHSSERSPQCNEKSPCNLTATCPLSKTYNFVISPVVNYFNTATLAQHVSLFSLLWFIIIFIFFSLSGTKLLTYILPLFPALGLIIGQLWYDFINDPSKDQQKPMLISAGLLMIIILVLSYLLIFHFNSLMPRDAKVLHLDEVKDYAAIVLSVGSIASFIFLYRGLRNFSFATILILISLTVFIALDKIVPNINNAAQGHLNTLITFINNYPEKNKNVITYGLVKPSIVFYTKRPIKLVEPDEDDRLEQYLQSKNRIFIVTRVKFLDELSQKSNVYIIDKGNRFALVTNKPYDRGIAKKYLSGGN